MNRARSKGAEDNEIDRRLIVEAIKLVFIQDDPQKLEELAREVEKDYVECLRNDGE